MSILDTKPLTDRQARSVARSLKQLGYKHATIKLCRGKIVSALANYLEPDRTDKRLQLLREIPVAASLQPGGGGTVISEARKRALTIIRDHEVDLPGQFARLMWPDSPSWKHRLGCGPNGSAIGGGMRMAGGSYLGKLRKAGLISGGIGGRSYSLTPEGAKLLSGIEQKKETRNQ